MNCSECNEPMTELDPREITDPQPSRFVPRWRCDEKECPAQGDVVEDDGTSGPTFDENGHLATVVVDAKKLTELTNELVALRGRVADLERENALPSSLLDLVRFMCNVWEKTLDWALKDAGADAFMSYPMIQGTANQAALRRIAAQPYSVDRIREGVEWMLAGDERQPRTRPAPDATAVSEGKGKR